MHFKPSPHAPGESSRQEDESNDVEDGKQWDR